MPTAPQINVAMTDSPAIAEARATLRAVADRIELDLAPLVAAAVALREAAWAAPQIAPEADAGDTVEHWVAEAIASPDHARSGLNP